MQELFPSGRPLCCAYGSSSQAGCSYLGYTLTGRSEVRSDCLGSRSPPCKVSALLPQGSWMFLPRLRPLFCQKLSCPGHRFGPNFQATGLRGARSASTGLTKGHCGRSGPCAAERHLLAWWGSSTPRGARLLRTCQTHTLGAGRYGCSIGQGAPRLFRMPESTQAASPWSLDSAWWSRSCGFLRKSHIRPGQRARLSKGATSSWLG